MKRLFLILCLLPNLLVSSENEEFDLIMVQIKKDISYSNVEVKKMARKMSVFKKFQQFIIKKDIHSKKIGFEKWKENSDLKGNILHGLGNTYAKINDYDAAGKTCEAHYIIVKL